MQTFLLVIWSLGALIGMVNFYLSFLHYPVHILFRGSKEDYRYVSGYPVMGSVFVFVGYSYSQLDFIPAASLALVFLDTGGIPWILFMCLLMALKSKVSNES